ncbi:MAG: hypothetical protein OEV42_13890 [Deltaproteobacteria bacterium]|nr:hypothetical protein [Deltaproteobacteria bacterium]
MSKKVFKLLPQEIIEKSISQREIVVPLEDALRVVDIMESKGILILGWEGWVKTEDGRVGHGSAPQGTVSLEEYSVNEAAKICRETIKEDAAEWKKENIGTSEKLHFCITIRA